MSKVKNGTPDFSQKSLCDSCSNFYSRTGDRETVQLCKAIYERPVAIRGKVFDCTDYNAKNRMSIHDMEKIALIIVKKGEQVGFFKAGEFRSKNDIGEFEDLVPNISIKQY